MRNSDQEQWKAKAQFNGVRLPVLVGVTALVVVAIIGIGLTLFDLASSHGFEITHEADADEAAEDDETSDGTFENLTTIVVHVGGAVNASGIQELQEGSRVQDAIEAAGGFADDAARDALNLARVLTDGEQLIVPTETEVESGTSLESDASSGVNAGISNAESSGRININTATEVELETLPGIGPATAAKIVSDREANGPYSTIEDLKRVSGIGDKKYAALVDLISVG